MIRTLLLLGLLCLQIFAVRADAEEFDHGAWDKLLKAHVVNLDGGRASQVNYNGMLTDRPKLQSYLGALARVTREDFNNWTKQEQLAFLINVYNSWTVELILSKYPDLQSIKDLGSLFQSPWKKKIVDLFAEKRSLDNVEHDLIRGSGRYNDPRIHFAVNCASVGCPALRNEAYTGEALEQQLEEATVLFLGDRSRNRYADNKLEVSLIFKWYREDFEQGWRGSDSLVQFFSLYGDAFALSPADSKSLDSGNTDIVFLKYDWKLNRTP